VISSARPSQHAILATDKRNLSVFRHRRPAGQLQPELGGGIVVPGFVDADVSADGGQESVPGLVGDGTVGGTA